METHENEHDDQAGRIDWTPEKMAFAGQWLIEKRLQRLRKKMPPEVFQELAQALDLLLSAWEAMAK